MEAGADIVDVGGVRAGQEGERVGAEEEIDRVLPFLEHARAAVPRPRPQPGHLALRGRAGGRAARARPGQRHLGRPRPGLVDVAARIGAGVVCSHTGGLPPRTDPRGVTYAPEPAGVVRDVLRTLAEGARRAEQAGIPAERILVDPTLDFGKTTAHSLEVLRHTADLTRLGYPILQALSRKDFVGESLDLPPDERLEGTLAATAVAAWLGATVFRAHDVRATRGWSTWSP